MGVLFYPKNIFHSGGKWTFMTCNLGKSFVVKYKCKAQSVGKVVGEKGPRPGA